MPETAAEAPLHPARPEPAPAARAPIDRINAAFYCLVAGDPRDAVPEATDS